jgi:hypothetical protein
MSTYSMTFKKGDVKLSLHATKAYTVEVWLHSFLASELDEGGRPQALADLPPEKEPLILI